MNIITMMSKALRPQAATSAKDVESCIVKWKSDRAYVKNVTGETFREQSEDNLKSILVNMLPEGLQLVMAPHFKNKTTYNEFEKELTDHIAFMDEQSKARKPIRALTGSEEDSSKRGEQEEWYDETGTKWLSMAVPGEEEGKRRRNG